MSCGLCCCTLVDEVDDTHIRDARIRFETDFTGAAIGIAHLDMVDLNLRTEFAETIFIEFGEREPAVACESTTSDAFGEKYVVRT